jgi:hypothetical protein
MDIGDFSLYAILCIAVQTPRETTPNAKVAGWTPARATISLLKINKPTERSAIPKKLSCIREIPAAVAQ